MAFYRRRVFDVPTTRLWLCPGPGGDCCCSEPVRAAGWCGGLSRGNTWTQSPRGGPDPALQSPPSLCPDPGTGRAPGAPPWTPLSPTGPA